MSLTDDQIEAKNFQKFYNAILPYLNGSAHSGFTPIGTVISVMGTTAPLNYLACDGTVYNIADYTELAAYFNAQFGSSNFFGGNGTTTFAVPDLRGEFLRGTGTNSHANQGSGANVGVHQDGTEHPNIVPQNANGNLESVRNTANAKKVDKSLNFDKPYYMGANNYIAQDGWDMPAYYTSRPTNTSVLYCIASKNIFMDAGSNYSTEEQVVGTWIDGKPIYQKTVNFGALPNATSKSVAHGIANIDNIIDYETIAITTTNRSTSLNYARQDIYGMCSDADRINMYVVTYSDRSGAQAWFTLQYTKTTD